MLSNDQTFNLTRLDLLLEVRSPRCLRCPGLTCLSMLKSCLNATADGIYRPHSTSEVNGFFDLELFSSILSQLDSGGSGLQRSIRSLPRRHQAGSNHTLFFFFIFLHLLVQVSRPERPVVDWFMCYLSAYKHRTRLFERQEGTPKWHESLMMSKAGKALLCVLCLGSCFVGPLA